MFDTAKPPKKKKRALGSFPCPDCSKVFTRSDHLARHHLNHEPKEVFVCKVLVEENGRKIECGKRFVRKDLRERHAKRHMELNEETKEELPVQLNPVYGLPVNQQNQQQNENQNSNLQNPNQHPDHQNPNLHPHHPIPDQFGYPKELPVEEMLPPQPLFQNPPLLNVHYPVEYHPYPIPPLQTSDFNFHYDRTRPYTPNEVLSWLFTDSSAMQNRSDVDMQLAKNHTQGPQNLYDAMSNHDMHFFQNENPLESFLNHTQNISEKETTPTSTYDSLSDIPVSPDSKSITPSYESLNHNIQVHGKVKNTPQNAHIYVDDSLVDILLLAVQVPKASVESCFDHVLTHILSYFLEEYWKTYHPQFPILHLPSFSTKECNPLLLLLMMIIGSNYCEVDSDRHRKLAVFKFSMLIAKPLRFMVIQHEDFKSPVQVWVLQTLNLLEWSEKNFLDRHMHERAHIHHGVTVQLLRRTPILGGNPSVTDRPTELSDDEVEDTKESDLELYKRWVESESLKRVLFMTFYLDTIDYVKFRHDPQIPFYQLQLLNLPCDDPKLWDNRGMGSFHEVVRRQEKIGKSSPHAVYFLQLLKHLLSLKPTSKFDILESSLFTKKILFAGLVSIMYQMQQHELQNRSLLVTNGIFSIKRSLAWKEMLTRALDNWVTTASCFGGERITPYKALNFTAYRCKFAVYHMTHIIGVSDINHYDIAIYGGSPANQNVRATEKDRCVVGQKLPQIWLQKENTIESFINKKAVVHSFLLLWELMIIPKDSGEVFLDWTAKNDYYDSMYAVLVATLVLWCFVHSTCGPESSQYDTSYLSNGKSYQQLISFSAEEGYQYLYRVKREFSNMLQQKKSPCSLHPLNLDTCSPHDSMIEHCKLLGYISNLRNISGLCFLVGTKLLESQWVILRENAKLIINCGFISLGKPNVLCEDLFDNDWPE